VEPSLPCVADLSLRVLEDFADPFEVPADVGTLGMDSPAAHFSQFATDLSQSHLDVTQPAVNSRWPAEAAPALLGLVVRLTSQDPPPLVASQQPSLPGISASASVPSHRWPRSGSRGEQAEGERPQQPAAYPPGLASVDQRPDAVAQRIVRRDAHDVRA
jgi:hypothetical protein